MKREIIEVKKRKSGYENRSSAEKWAKKW